jgi:hypothetical protein
MALNNHSLGLNYPSVGEGYTPAYQISAVPFVSSSTIPAGEVQEIEFSNITRFFEIKNTGANVLAFGFTQNGVEGTNKFVLSGSQSYAGEIRTTRLFVSASGNTTYSILAGLTNIPTRFGSVLTGSGVG